MLIRSQDKSRLINFNNIRELRFWECAQGFDITDRVCPIGHYFTREKALMQFKMVRTLNLVQNSAILGAARYVDTDVVKM